MYWDTFVDKDSIKAKSYEYRGILWHIAYTETAKEPVRMLFGYGGLSTETMDLSRYFEKEAGGTVALTGFTSWDNQMACDLMEFGYVGFLTEIALLLAMMWTFIKFWRMLPSLDRNFIVAFISAIGIYLYALSNVYIFSPQLKCLFWALAACGMRFGHLAVAEVMSPSPGRTVENEPGHFTTQGAAAV
jgi:hypothetical protein